MARRRVTRTTAAYRILSVDGGGIIALGLAHGLAPADLVALYRDRAKEIFDDSWLDDLQHHYCRLAPILPERIGLDDVDKIGALVKYAQGVNLEATITWLRQNLS